MSTSKLHEVEMLTKNNLFSRVAGPGGWVYRVWDFNFGDEAGYTALCFVPSPKAPHVRDARRLKVRDGWGVTQGKQHSLWWARDDGSDGFGTITLSLNTTRYIAYHADRSFTMHESLLEAHDALRASGSESPFVAVTGPAVKAEEVKP